MKFLTLDGLKYYHNRSKEVFVAQEDGKGLSSNDFTDALLNKLNGIATGATRIIVDSAVNANSTNPVQNKVITAAVNLKAPLASPALTGTPTAPTATSGTNTTQIATTAFVQSAISTKIAAADAMIFKGTIGTGGTVTALPNTHSTGWTYKVITAGTYAGQTCEVGDMIICLTDGTAANNDDWTVVQTNIDGAVTGPTSSVASRVVVFGDTTGKVIKDSGYTIAKSIPSSAVFTDTHYNANLKVGASATATANAASSNGNTYINLVENSTIRDSHLIKGGGATTVTSDASGIITITSTNTTYSAATTSAAGLMSASDKSKLNGITESADSVSFTASLTSGTKVGTITINGTNTDLYCQTNTNTTYTKGTYNYLGLIKPSKSYTSAATLTTAAASATTAPTIAAITTTAGRYYAVEMDSNGVPFVNVPWQNTNTTYANMTAATASAAGKAGLVPAPPAGAQAKFLRGDGTWQDIVSSITLATDDDIAALFA